MRVTRFVSLLVMMCFLAGFGLDAANAKQSTDEMMMDAIKAVDTGRTSRAMERLKAILEQDPTNYHALVMLGQLYSDRPGSDPGRVMLEAERYLLLAALAQPHRPEAYLALAQLYYDAGYLEEGDKYARKAQNQEPNSYEAFCLLGQRYEDSGNYVGAVRQYFQGAEYYNGDPYLQDKLYMAASQGGLSPYQTRPVRVDEDAKVIWYVLEENHPDYDIMKALRESAGRNAEGRGRYRLPLTQFEFCGVQESPKVAYKDLYEAFIKASTKDPKEYARLRKELDSIRKQALAQMETEKGVAAKAKALYMFLKQRVLQHYALDEGILAQQVLDDKKYLCLNASILYTLIANEAGLPVKGIITPGHAFARVNADPRDIEVELTAEPKFGTTREAGFDVDWWDQFKQLNRVDAYGGLLRGTSKRLVGEVTPETLTAFQFTNVLANGRKQILKKHKEEIEYASNLESVMRENNRERATRLQELHSKYEGEPLKLARLVERTDEKHDEKQKKLEKEITTINLKLATEMADYLSRDGLQLVKEARALAPANEELAQQEARIYKEIAKVQVLPTVQAINDRKKRKTQLLAKLNDTKRDIIIEKKQFSDDSKFVSELKDVENEIDQKLRELDIEQKDRWGAEKTTWLNAISTLQQGVKNLPCSSDLRRQFERYCWRAVTLAKQNNDPVVAAEVIQKGLTTLPDSEFSKHYRVEQFGA